MKVRGNDKKILETLFEMRSGYVLDFSDRRMKDFFYEEFEIDMYDAKYDLDFPSKQVVSSLFFMIFGSNSKLPFGGKGPVWIHLVNQYIQTYICTPS